MYAIYGNIYHQYTPNVSIYTIHGSYGISDMSIASTPQKSRHVVTCRPAARPLRRGAIGANQRGWIFGNGHDN